MKKYDNYKDSGIEWIGEIPEHWDESKIKYLSKEPSSLFIDGDWIESKVIIEKGIRYITTGNIKVGYYSEQGAGYISEETFAELNCTEVFEGDLVISRLNNPIGRACIIPNLNNRIVTSVDNVIFRPDSNVNKFYLLYLFSSKEYFEITDLISRGATMQRISRGLYGNIKIPLPSIEEQTQIASYLDHKTTQIDHLITKKEQFISLLQEERTAVINQAVTKGLDPKVKMKDSGIEWLGEIPEHWEVKRLRNLVETIKTGSTPPSEEIQYFEPNEINWYGPGDFDSLILGNSKRKISKLAIEENKCRLFPANSILLIGIGATVGKVGLALEDCSSNQQLNAIIMKNEYNSIFYLYFLSTIKDIIVMEASSATLPIFNQTQTKNIITPVPPSKEQVEIANFIAKKELEIKSIISKSQQEIELLKEYKTALISEVVTGKVDVREMVLN